MDQSVDSLSTVQDLLDKSFELSNKSNDALLALFTRSFETATVVLSPTSNDEHILRSIESLEYERTLSLEKESKEFNAHRFLSFALVKCLQATLLQLREKNNACQRDHYQMEIFPRATPSTVKQEPLDEFIQVNGYDGIDRQGDWTEQANDLLVERGEKRRSTRTRTPNIRYREREEDKTHLSFPLSRSPMPSASAVDWAMKYGEILDGHKVERHSDRNCLAAANVFNCSKCGKRFRSLRGMKFHMFMHSRKALRCDCIHIMMKETFARHEKICLHAASKTDKNIISKWTQPKDSTRAPVAALVQPDSVGTNGAAKMMQAESNKKAESSRGKMGMTGLPIKTCTICGKKLHNKSHLEYHMLQHTGERPFHCQYCYVSFRAVHTRNAHIRRVHGIRPHQCSTCGMQFELQPELQFHMQQHNHEQLQEE